MSAGPSYDGPTLFGDLPVERPKPKLYTDNYADFVEKFKPKLTTDDCITPAEVYDAVLNWVREECGIAEDVPIVRPFWPGGDYEACDYPEGCVVIDNPPFSLMAQICRFYVARGVRFFLFAPYLTLFSVTVEGLTKIVTNSDIVYENGATVNSSFLSNLFGDVSVMTAPKLARAVEDAVDRVRKAKRVSLPKYAYPDELVTSTRLGRIAKFAEVRIRRDECFLVGRLDAQKAKGKAIFGKGYLISERVAAELRAAWKFPLSDREKEIIKGLK